MTSKKQTALARTHAHERLARQRQERIEREQANETDLTAYLVLQQQLTDTERTYQRSVRTIRDRQATHLRNWRARGEKPAVIADLVGMTVTELNRLIKKPAEASEPQPAAPHGNIPSS
ncbi:hypothetical protein [Nocardia macrotermitis]|uniref:Uncharacterized protein n=1 Tax=Nocardia macrotermitis TaxID=2585198 RepID=A0A7K0DFP5_9NOCA|nr:hypothetical protein [Nocardia macrotermitis]MQY24361.1 hypothetical protein [Nocardia macrotermitis]